MQLAGCIIKNKAGKVLLLHRNTAKLVHWEIPGGKVEAGEEPADTAVREMAEELDVTVRIVQHIDTATFEQDGDHFGYSWFEAEITEGEPRIAEPETFDGLAYFSLVEMQQMFDELSSNAKNFVNFLHDR